MSDRTQINFRCPEDVFKIFEAAAKRSRMNLTQWLIAVGLTAAGDRELLEQLERVAKKKASSSTAGASKRRPSRGSAR